MTARHKWLHCALVQSVVEPGDVVLDIGAGEGLSARAAFQAGASRVIAVDPLLRLPRDWPFAARTMCRRCAVADGGVGDAIPFLVRDEAGLSSLWPRPDASHGPPVPVAATTIAALLALYRTDVLVIDAEGAERFLATTPLTGLRGLVIEVHPWLMGPADETMLFIALVEQGFTVSKVSHAGPLYCYYRAVRE